MTEYNITIKIGCPPGNPRPYDIFEMVFNSIAKQKYSDNTNNFCMEAINNKDKYNSSFGDFSWNIKYNLKEDEFEYIKYKFMEIMTLNYENNIIRFASIYI